MSIIKFGKRFLFASVAVFSLFFFVSPAHADTIDVSYGRGGTTVGTFAGASSVLASFTPANVLTEGDTVYLYFSSDILITSGNLAASDFTIQQSGGAATAASGLSYIASVNSGPFAGYHRIRLTIPSAALSNTGLGEIIVRMSGTAGENEIQNPTNASADDTFGISTADDNGTQTNIDYTAGALDHIVISPSSESISADDTQSYSTEGFDSYGNSTGSVTNATLFSITDGAGGSFDGSTYHAEHAGDWTVTGHDGSFTDTSSLHVSAGELHHITISPGSASIATTETQNYTAEAFDQRGNSLGDVTDSTTFGVDSGPGSFDGHTYNPGGAADGIVVEGNDGGFTDTATINVTLVDENGPLDHIVISPDNSSINADQIQTFSAEGYDSEGHDLGDVTGDTTFSVTSGGGSFDAHTYHPGTAGSGITVQGDDSGKTDTATINVTHGAPDHMTFDVQPTNTVKKHAISPTVQVSVRDYHGNLIDDSSGKFVTLVALDGSHVVPVSGGVRSVNTGTATFPSLSIEKEKNHLRLRASVNIGGVANILSSFFNITEQRDEHGPHGRD
ncbi:MAG: hypothetical protein V4438_02340 [Patescibacteria group bacterium]